ncbi:hypothetical protein V8E51_001019 [Hyaloscypha variabilis]
MATTQPSTSAALSALGEPFKSDFLCSPNEGNAAGVFGIDLVTITVGRKFKPFIVHKKLLCDRCEFFSKAFNSGFREGKTGVIDFPDVDHDVMFAFCCWLYYDFKLPDSEEKASAASAYIERYLLPLFVFADRLLQDFQRKHKQHLCASLTRRIFEEVGPHRKLHMYFVADFATWEVMNDDLSSRFLWDFHKELNKNRDLNKTHYFFWKYHLRKLYPRGLYKMWRRNGSRSYGQCFFHTHAEGEICYFDYRV